MREGNAKNVVADELDGKAVGESEMAGYVHGADVGLKLMAKAGGGLPLRTDYATDVKLFHGDAARINMWRLSNGVIGYAGCAMYNDSKGVKSSPILLDREIGSLKMGFDQYASKHLITHEN